MATILGSFFVISLPLALLQSIPNFVGWLPYAVLLEVVGLGTTHFFITLAVYLRSENLDYFRSSRRNLLVYVWVPLSIFALFATLEAFALRTRFPAAAWYFLAFVRLCDFFHVGRQSAGMLQIWKRGKGLPDALRLGEQLLFVGLALLQWQTFLLGGRFRSDLLVALLPALALFGLFVALASAHVAALARASDGRTTAFMPLAYLTLQAACAASAVYDTRLYLTALAMHYVEYHAIMAPRLFRTPLAPERTVDRVFGALRARKWPLYAALLALVIAFELRKYAPADAPSTLFLVHVFDGVFLVHYFLEAFLWKFRNPHYRKLLAPLYFEPAAEVAPPPALAARPVPVGSWAGAMLLAASVLFASQQRWFVSTAEDLQRRVIDPLHATNHLRWGVQLAAEGELEAARSHFEEAARRNPEDPQARKLLLWMDQHVQRGAQL